MAKLGTITYKGTSGKVYSFNIYPFDAKFNEIGVVYLVTKRAINKGEKATHKLLYVGETGDMSTRFDSHHKQGCFDEKGANCKCIHQESSEKKRLEIESDLVEKYTPTCNG